MRWEVKERKDFCLAKKRYLYSSLLPPGTSQRIFGVLPRYGAVSRRLRGLYWKDPWKGAGIWHLQKRIRKTKRRERDFSLFQKENKRQEKLTFPKENTPKSDNDFVVTKTGR